MRLCIARTQTEIVDHFLVRGEVFIKGQQIDWDIEFDGFDQECILFNAYLENRCIGAARLHHNKVGRVATLEAYRHRGVATALMGYIEDYAREQGIPELVLNAQLSVREFYARLGYLAEGDIFLEADIEHIRMTKRMQ
jgi:predicted GNAT family N-acyltransferase